MCHSGLEENNTIHDQRLRRSSCRKWRLKLEAVTKLLYYMSVKNRRASKYCDIYPYFFGGLTVLVWNRYVFPRSKMAVFQTYHKKHGLKIAVVWVEVLQLHKYTITVITWLCLNARMKITKALRKSIWMFTYFYASFFTNFRQLNTMMWLENTDSVTLEESKGFFQLQPPEEFCKKRCTK